MIITVLMKLKLRNCNHIFRDELGPGVLVMQEVNIDVGDGPREPWLSVTLMRCEDEFIAQEIKVEMEKIHAQNTHQER